MSLKYEKEMQEFLSIMEWKDELNVNTENEQVSVATGINISGQSGRAIIEANSDNDIFDFYIYFIALKCKAKKNEQMKLLLTEINHRSAFGRFEYYMYEDSLFVRWRNSVDFEGGAPSGITIKNNFQPGWDAADRFSDTLTAVAITNQSAEEAIAEYDEEKMDKQKAEIHGMIDAAVYRESDDGPSEL